MGAFFGKYDLHSPKPYRPYRPTHLVHLQTRVLHPRAPPLFRRVDRTGRAPEVSRAPEVGSTWAERTGEHLMGREDEAD